MNKRIKKKLDKKGKKEGKDTWHQICSTTKVINKNGRIYSTLQNKLEEIANLQRKIL